MLDALEVKKAERQQKAKESAARSQQEREERQAHRQRLKDEWKSKTPHEGVPLYKQMSQKFHVRTPAPRT
jgi:hypothetical protein